MGKKQKLEIGKGINGVTDMLAKIAIQQGILIGEVRELRKMFSGHIIAQQELVKCWMKKDLDHHYKDNKVTLAALEAIKDKSKENAIVKFDGKEAVGMSSAMISLNQVENAIGRKVEPV